MAEERVQRKLTTILAADVEGYTRLMRADEEETLKTLVAYREIIDGLIARHDGRVFSTAGDSVLAEFGSAVEAVRCAVSIQEEIATRNAVLPGDRKLTFRIGINVGDVMVRDGDLLGDGVNVAARLEGLAGAGGICVSGSVFEQVRHKLSFGFEDMGAQQVKNIAEPIPTFRLIPGSDSGAAAETPGAARRGRIPVMAVVAVVVALILAAGGVMWWQPWAPDVTTASIDKAAVERPDKPSIAVLPFTNMSDDREQEYFSDGMTEDLITDLSKVSGLFVIARNSTFAYKGQTRDIRAIARELNARYVVEGSVRKIGGRVRINAQLIDASTGNHMWAERYDRDFKDVFALQDEVLGKIVEALKVTLTPAESRRVTRPVTRSPVAYDLYLRGLRQESYFTPAGNRESTSLFKRAIELDPGFALAHAHLAQAYSLAIENRWTEKLEEYKNMALAAAKDGIRFDDELPYAYWSLGRLYSRSFVADLDGAKTAFERAIALNPSYADGHMFLALVLVLTGQAEEALGMIENAMRINPHFPFWYLHGRGMAQLVLTNYQAAAHSLEKAIERNPTVAWMHRVLISVYGHMGKRDEAEWQMMEIESLGQQATIARMMQISPIRHPAYRNIYEEGLRKAGMPEE